MCHQTSDVICDAQPTPDAGAKETGSLNHRWWDLERRELLCLWQFLTELNFQLLYDLAVALLGPWWTPLSPLLAPSSWCPFLSLRAGSGVLLCSNRFSSVSFMGHPRLSDKEFFLSVPSSWEGPSAQARPGSGPVCPTLWVRPWQSPQGLLVSAPGSGRRHMGSCT